MKYFILCAATVLMSLSLFAQSTFEGTMLVNYEGTNNGKTTKSKLGITVKASKVVIDPSVDPTNATAPKIIFNTTNGDIHVLADQDGRKVALKMNQQNIEALGGFSSMVNTYGLADGKTNATVTATDEYKTISGYKCRKHLVKSDDYNSEAWITNDLGFNLGSILKDAGDVKSDALKNGMILAGSGKSAKTGESYKMTVDVTKKDIPSDEVKVPTEFMVMDITAMITTMLQQNKPEEVKKMLQKMIPQ